MATSEPTFEEVMDTEMAFADTAMEFEVEVLPEASAEPTFDGASAPTLDEAEYSIPIPTPPKFPKPIPIPIAKRAVSGMYKGTLGSFYIELRVDVDKANTLSMVSGDFFQTTGGTTKYFGSFMVKTPVVTVTTTEITARGLGSFTWSAGCPVVQVKIQRRSILQPPAPAQLQFFTTSGTPGTAYGCVFIIPAFRAVRLEVDRTSDLTTPVFNLYNTGSFPSGGPARNLSVVSAYAEAGIKMLPTSGSDVVDMAHAGADATWDNSELHHAMVNHFSLWRDEPQWSVWLLAAQRHVIGSGLYGIMFDQQGKQRQGCAVFHQGIGGTTNEKLRLQLYTYVHELGHCFNLLHSWQKGYAVPPQPNRPNSLSWMNYPWYYPGGPAAFWSSFNFAFDREELIHLRHGFYNNVIMGGNDFTVGSSLESNRLMQDPIRDESGLALRISTHQNSFALGEPVVLQIELNSTSTIEKRVHSWLHPNFDMVKIAIRKPGGEVLTYEPLMDHLVAGQEKMINNETTIMDSAYIGFGKDGFYFDQPGNYLIKASYASLDGSEIMSNTINLRVRYPITAKDEELADLFMGSDQGALLYLLGSDSEYLQKGNDAFELVLDKYPKDNFANYVRFIKGTNAQREFKRIMPDKKVQVRKANLDESLKLLGAVADANFLDPVTMKMALTNLQRVQKKTGDTNAANRTQAAISSLMTKKKR